MKFVLLVALLASTCFASSETEKAKPNYACSLNDDPHLRSFDGYPFDFHGFGWYDLVRHAHLKISAEFSQCGGGQVSCVRGVYIWTDSCSNPTGCPVLEILLNNSVATFTLNGVTPHQDFNSPYYQGDPALIPLTVSTYASFKSGTLTVTGCHVNCVLKWTVTARRGMIVITLNNPGGSSEGSWGTDGLCGTPNGNSLDDLSPTVPSSDSWRKKIPEITAYGQSLNTPAGANGAHLNAYTGKANAHPASQPIPYTDAQIANILVCGLPEWRDAAGQDKCNGEVKTACNTENAKINTYTECMIDNCRAYNSFTGQQLIDMTKEWDDHRLLAATLYNAAIATNESIMLGLFIGLGVGLVFIVAAVAFFAKNPELLPFSHKKKKVQKELAATDVLK